MPVTEPWVPDVAPGPSPHGTVVHATTLANALAMMANTECDYVDLQAHTHDGFRGGGGLIWFGLPSAMSDRVRRYFAYQYGTVLFEFRFDENPALQKLCPVSEDHFGCQFTKRQFGVEQSFVIHTEPCTTRASLPNVVWPPVCRVPEPRRYGSTELCVHVCRHDTCPRPGEAPCTLRLKVAKISFVMHRYAGVASSDLRCVKQFMSRWTKLPCPDCNLSDEEWGALLATTCMYICALRCFVVQVTDDARALRLAGPSFEQLRLLAEELEMRQALEAEYWRQMEEIEKTETFERMESGLRVRV
eukprot:Rhum_TRINITY_DN13802_c0_g1::Rhum_TRINITY_DN13802_c0_g1_i1::g.64481::m.64481